MADNFQPQDYLIIAKQTLAALKADSPISKDSSKNYAWIRSIISRTYYASFLSVREKLRNLNFSDLIEQAEKENRIHGFVSQLCINLWSIDMLTELRDMRNKADYKLPNEYETSLVDADWAIKLADNILGRISSSS